jgi:hypothetical protein
MGTLQCQHPRGNLKLCCDGKIRSYICPCGVELYEGLDKKLRNYEDQKRYMEKLKGSGY